ncbi:hypothetical protein RGU70_07545 [Herbaspirillum sp. RTI4]|uniref:hypothetical protein n=1 Tax=Herbaspirillum sp. RTI4 TaxID=3048640 RepID=UPI002AB44C74|nr:hypothetical protein [Herbaspirillum sp. RTI4]MDY7578172.1 hypothetical protein [Herbaspirillum sp. RTI4]MEA9980761.1 hypothetical protein [Herbaspirillum sp. RTI4]
MTRIAKTTDVPDDDLDGLLNVPLGAENVPHVGPAGVPALPVMNLTLQERIVEHPYFQPILVGSAFACVMVVIFIALYFWPKKHSSRKLLPTTQAKKKDKGRD